MSPGSPGFHSLLVCNESFLPLCLPSLPVADGLVHLALVHIVRALSSEKCLKLLSLKDVPFS